MVAPPPPGHWSNRENDPYSSTRIAPRGGVGCAQSSYLRKFEEGEWSEARRGCWAGPRSGTYHTHDSLLLALRDANISTRRTFYTEQRLPNRDL